MDSKLEKIVFILFMPSLALADGPRYQHKDTFNQMEFENVYQASDRINSRINNLFINVKDYGAVCNGIANDYTPIQNAISAASNSGAGIVVLPEGTCMIGTGLTMFSYVTLQGQGRGSTTIKAMPNMNSIGMVINNGSVGNLTSDIVLQDILFDLNGQNQIQPNPLKFSYTTLFQMRRCEIRNPYDSLFLLTGSPDTSINLHSVFEDDYFNGTNQVVGSDVVDIGSGSDIRMTRCRFFDAKAGSGSTMLSAAIMDVFTLTDSYFDGNDHGATISLSGIDGGKVDGCEIKNSKEAAIRMQSWNEILPSKVFENFSIVNNNIHENEFAGIWIRSATGYSTDTVRQLKIADNEIWRNQQSGIRCQVSDSLTIRDNSIYANSISGLGSYAALDFGGGTGSGSNNNILVSGNRFYDTQINITQTLLYNLNFVDMFLSKDNNFSQIATTATISNASNYYIQEINLLSSNDTAKQDMLGAKGLYSVGSLTRSMTASSANVAVTGLGFSPKAIQFSGTIDLSTTTTWGMASGSSNQAITTFGYQVVGTVPTVIYAKWTTNSIALDDGSGNNQIANVASYDPDGFTLAWTKTGTPKAATATIFYMAQR